MYEHILFSMGYAISNQFSILGTFSGQLCDHNIADDMNYIKTDIFYQTTLKGCRDPVFTHSV